MARRLQVANQGPDSVDWIRRNQTLPGKNVLQLLVVFAGNLQVMRFFDDDRAVRCITDTTPAGRVHRIEQVLFQSTQVCAIGAVELTSKTKLPSIVDSEIGIGDFHVQYLPAIPCHLFQSGKCCSTRHTVRRIEPHVRRCPSRKRTAQNSDAETSKSQARKIADHLPLFAQFSKDRRCTLSFANELYPFLCLEDGSVLIAVEMLPVGGLEVDNLALHLSVHNFIYQSGCQNSSPSGVKAEYSLLPTAWIHKRNGT